MKYITIQLSVGRPKNIDFLPIDLLLVLKFN